jgi:hypothetical protein
MRLLIYLPRRVNQWGVEPPPPFFFSDDQIIFRSATDQEQDTISDHSTTFPRCSSISRELVEILKSILSLTPLNVGTNTTKTVPSDEMWQPHTCDINSNHYSRSDLLQT